MRKVKLKTLCEIKNGYAFQSSDYVDAGYRVIRITNVQKGLVVDDNPKFISEMVADKARNFQLACDDILISLTGNVGRVGRIQACHLPAVLNQRVGSIRSISKELDENYLFQYLNSYYFENDAIKNSNGIAQLNLSSKWIEDHQIPLPPLTEQKRIAAILDKADAIRRKRQQAIKLADDFLRATFLYMFGDPVTNPKGWKERPLKTLVMLGDKINYGVVQPGKDYPGGVPIVRVGDLLNGEITRNSLKLIDPAIDQRHKKSRLAGDEILIACVGSIGKVALADKRLAGCNIARAVARVRPDKTLSRYYLAKFLETPFLQRYFFKETRTVSQPTLNINLIENAPILLPPREVQEEYDKIYFHVMRMTKRVVESVEISTNLFNSLTQRAFQGEL